MLELSYSAVILHTPNAPLSVDAGTDKAHLQLIDMIDYLIIMSSGTKICWLNIFSESRRLSRRPLRDQRPIRRTQPKASRIFVYAIW